jgi:Tfp pilus assembly protein PilP
MKRTVIPSAALLFCCSVALLLCLGACKQAPPPPQAQAAKASQTAAPAPKEDIVAEPKVEEEVYLYDKTGKRDPFVSLIKIEEEARKGETPLENYDVSAIRIIGIVWNEMGYFAEVILPDGKAYTVKEGTPVGVHKGKIQRITKTSIIVKEYVKDYKGEIKPKETILKLREEEE